MRALALGLALASAVASAEAGWLTAQGRVSAQLEWAVFAGPNSVGAGFLRADPGDPMRGVGLEAAWSIGGRVAEVRGARRWQLNPTGFATSSFTAGLTGLVVPVGAFDLGLGPHVGLNLALGGRVFSVQLAALSGVELFVRGDYRFTERLQLGVRAQLGRVTLGLAGRAGVDLIPDRNFIVRAEAIFSLGVLGPPSQ